MSTTDDIHLRHCNLLGFSGAVCVFTVRSLPRPPAIPLAALAGATLAPVIASW
jgi:hypothetical protein